MGKKTTLFLYFLLQCCCFSRATEFGNSTVVGGDEIQHCGVSGDGSIVDANKLGCQQPEDFSKSVSSNSVHLTKQSLLVNKSKEELLLSQQTDIIQQQQQQQQQKQGQRKEKPQTAEVTVTTSTQGKGGNNQKKGRKKWTHEQCHDLVVWLGKFCTCKTIDNIPSQQFILLWDLERDECSPMDWMVREVLLLLSISIPSAMKRLEEFSSPEVNGWLPMKDVFVVNLVVILLLLAGCLVVWLFGCLVVVVVVLAQFF